MGRRGPAVSLKRLEKVKTPYARRRRDEILVGFTDALIECFDTYRTEHRTTFDEDSLAESLDAFYGEISRRDFAWDGTEQDQEGNK